MAIIAHHGIFYEKTRSVSSSGRRYKYRLTREYSFRTTIRGRSGGNEYLRIGFSGMLHTSERYAWDGPSGPTIDTQSFMRGSLVHDALYQLMREGVLDHRLDRKAADKALVRVCKADGMRWFRRRYVYRWVRLTGAPYARPASLS